MKRINLTLCLFLALFIAAFPQKKSEIKEKFVEAESWFLFEEYRDALPLYEELLDIDPENGNYNYRAGICYLNIPDEKEKSISFLEKATQNVNPDYKEGSFRETGAPMDAYYYLGNAYRVNNRLEKAIETYLYFKENLDEKVYDVAIVDNQIQNTRNALELRKNPVFLDLKNLGGTINTRFSDFNPVVSGDESTIVYTQQTQFQPQVFYSKKVNGRWTTPVNMSFALGAEDLSTASLSYDGKTLYLYKLDEYDGNVYVSRWQDDQWSRIEKLNENINTKFWESHACESKDGKKLYFTSNRKGGFGGLDIYVSSRDSAGQWGPPTNLGDKINSPYNEETPFISEDGKTLYFSSYGHFNIGGYDIFYATRFDNGEWSSPLNMGFPINTPDDDLFYVPSGDHFAYYSIYSETGYGMNDIFRLEIFSDEHPRKFLIKGIVSLGALPSKFFETISIDVVDVEKKDTITTVQPMSSGAYDFTISAGEYDLNFMGDGFKPVTERIKLLNSSKDSIYRVPETRLMLTDISAVLEFMDSTFDATAGDPLDIHLLVEPGSILTISGSRDSVILFSDDFAIYDSLFTYTYTPEPGDNNLTFTLTDKYGNTVTKDLLIEAPVVMAIIPVTDTVSDVEPELFIVSNEVLEFRNRLSHYAEGDLKTTIDAADLQAEQIATPDHFVTHLKEIAPENGYTPADVDALLLLAASRGASNAERFRTTLKGNTTPPLERVLDTLNLATHNISSSAELMAYLQSLVDAGVITQEQLDEALSGMIIAEDPELTKMRAQLDSLAEGELKEVLAQLEPEKEKIYSTYELIEFLRRNAAILGYSEEELALLLARLAANGNPSVEDFIDRFTIYTEGTLRETIESLDLKEQKIRTIDDFIIHLLDVSDANQYTSVDIMNALIDMIAETDIDMAKVKDLILAEEKGRGKSGIIIPVVIIVGGLFIFLFFYYRKRKKKKD